MSTMTPERWRQVKAVLAEALDAPPAERAAFVERACGDDRELRREVESLLAAATDGFLARPAIEEAALGGADAGPGEAPGEMDLMPRLAAALGPGHAIERELGGGGMSRVFVAMERALGRRVVVKVLRPDLAVGLSVARFGREVRLEARLQHPHIVPVLATGAVDGLPFYTMPYVEGETLRARLRRAGALPVADALRLVRELADALAYAHAQGIVHRDLKPENVLLSGSHAVVADFGVAKAVRAATEGCAAGTSTTGVGVAVGTPAYMAPEQALGDPATDHRADLYALGVIAYELLAGAHPFAGRAPPAMLAAHLTEPPAPLAARRPDAPPAFAELVTRLLAKRPEERPQRAEEVVHVLDALTTPAAGTAPAGGAGRRRLARSAAALLGAALTLAGAIAVARGWRETNDSDADPAASGTRIAVLPFLDPSADSAQAYLADGMTDALAAELGRVAGVAVTSRTSAMHYRRTRERAPEIARALRVDALVEGSVERDGGRVRVTTWLVRGRDGRRVWSGTFERDLGDVLVLQEEVARAIAARVGPTPAQRGRPAATSTRGRRLTDPTAYDLYLKGRYHYARYGQQAFRTAAGYFDAAVARDSAFAEAYAAKAFACTMTFVVEHHAPLAGCEAAARRALALDEALPEAHAAVAHVRMYEWDWAAADAEFRRALALNPSSVLALQWYAQLLRQTMRADEALAVIRRAEALDPLDLYVRTQVGWVLFNQRRYEEALAQWNEVLALDPGYGLAIYNQGLVHVLRGRPREALAAAERAAPRLGDASLPITFLRALGHAAAGDRVGALRLARAMEAADFDRSLIACVHHLLGDDDAALALLEESFRRHDPFLPNTTSEPLFDGLRTHPRFRALRARLGLADR